MTKAARSLLAGYLLDVHLSQYGECGEQGLHVLESSWETKLEAALARNVKSECCDASARTTVEWY